MNLKNKFIKFIGVGVINTIASYLAYILFALFLDYQIAYAIAFVFGIILSFVLNTKYVFEVQQTIKKFLLFPLVYLIQYLLGAGMMSLIVEIFEINKFIAPLIVTMCLIPVSYLMSKKILEKS
ncbi:MAG: GtrA family protein [Aliarcobacter sp.]|jgi:putative flippase GtrA|nr:GtrA family protein [Aliarcobacter sp.]